MTTIPKPKYCGQNWLDMKPIGGGRICAQCDKTIIDFSKMSWEKIEQLQKQNNNAVCGMYNPKQLDNWGNEIPTRKDNLLKVAAVTGLTISLSLPTYSQTVTPSDSIVIKGRVTDEDTGEEIPFANVILKKSEVNTRTDVNGNFKLVVTNLPTTSLVDTLEVNRFGYGKTQIIFSDLKEISHTDNNFQPENVKLNLTLESESNIIAYYITIPTRTQRIKWKHL